MRSFLLLYSIDILHGLALRTSEQDTGAILKYMYFYTSVDIDIIYNPIVTYFVVSLHILFAGGGIVPAPGTAEVYVWGPGRKEQDVAKDSTARGNGRMDNIDMKVTWITIVNDKHLISCKVLHPNLLGLPRVSS